MSMGLTSDSFISLAPLVALSAGALVLMLQLSVRRNMGLSYAITLASLLAAAASTQLSLRLAPLQVTPLLRGDDYALLFSLLFCVAGAITSIIAREYLTVRRGQNEEFFLLLLLATLGAVTLAYATHLASLMIGMELLGVSLYALIAYPDRQSLPLEAAIKYLVLSAAASAIFLFGYALLYTLLGALDHPGIAEAVRLLPHRLEVIALAGAAMVMAGLAFKLSAVPFHMWTPDVYEGAPAPVSGFLAAVSKAAVFAALLRWWLETGFYTQAGLQTALAILAGASMLVGNLLALRQDNIKRLLAYSSIAHIGYLLVLLVACGLSPQPREAVEAATYYLLAYTITTLAAFALLGLLSRDLTASERDRIEDMTGLFWQRPWLSILLGVALLSLAGIPLTAGFIGKFYIFAVGVGATLWSLLGILVIGSGISIYYYLRVIFTMTRQPEESELDGQRRPSLMARLACVSLVAAMLYLGILPETLMLYLRTIL